MKKTIKTERVLTAFRVLNTAKYTKMSDEDKIKVWKIARALKPIADKFEDDSKDAAEKFKPTDDFTERLQKAQEFERMRNAGEDMANAKMGATEYGEFLKEFQKYNQTVGEAVKEFAEKEVEVEFDVLTEEAFGKLMASNEWEMSQTLEIGQIIL